MKSEDYQQILQHNVGPSVRKLGLPQRSWVFQQDNDPKHTSKSTRKWFERKHWRLLWWPAMSPDLNPIEHLWRDLEMAVWRRHPSNIRDLEQFAKEWSKIPAEHCKKLIDGYRKRLVAVYDIRRLKTDYLNPSKGTVTQWHFCRYDDKMNNSFKSDIWKFCCVELSKQSGCDVMKTAPAVLPRTLLNSVQTMNRVEVENVYSHHSGAQQRPVLGIPAKIAAFCLVISGCQRHLFRASGDQPFNLSSAFPMISHPVFGLHAASSGHSEFGGLGMLGAPTALAAHPQLSPFPEWWRAADPHTRAAFFPPLLGIPPIFTPPSQNHDSSLHLRSAGKNNRGGTEKGMNGSINGGSPTLVTSNCAPVLSTATTNSPGQVKNASTGVGSRASGQEQSKSDGRSEKNKDKQKQRKKTVESSSSSDSGSSSDTSSDGASSSDSDDLEEEDQSIEESDDDDSESESEAQTKKKSKVLIHNIPDLKTDGKQVEKLAEKRVHQQLPLIPDPQNRSPFQSQQRHPQVLSQHLPFIFQSSQAKEEAVNKHTSVIQCTGLVSPTKPSSLLNQSNKDVSSKLGAPSSDGLKPGNKITSEEPMPQPSDLRIKRL
ncbi:unnamed protein product [Ranitomeya imitator]|uniref:Tc1-like transposase DDE domain-containing protein n=1 Tax=Ranitomeya imitator TaxID=111125 RepID=A0ABN9LAR4_9NEOB|nr:unnamed protein product [Ranitomeya imitator]